MWNIYKFFTISWICSLALFETAPFPWNLKSLLRWSLQVDNGPVVDTSASLQISLHLCLVFLSHTNPIFMLHYIMNIKKPPEVRARASPQLVHCGQILLLNSGITFHLRWNCSSSIWKKHSHFRYCMFQKNWNPVNPVNFMWNQLISRAVTGLYFF